MFCEWEVGLNLLLNVPFKNHLRELVLSNKPEAQWKVRTARSTPFLLLEGERKLAAGGCVSVKFLSVLCYQGILLSSYKRT